MSRVCSLGIRKTVISMKIAVCSLFRDNAHDVRRCFHDRSLWSFDKSELVHVCVEGDSTDLTYDALLSQAEHHNVVVQQLHSHKPKYGSVICPERMEILGRTSNYALELALEQDPSHILWLDSDISTPPDLLPRLLRASVDVIAPMFFFEKSNYFRDTWGYRSMNGDEFTNRRHYSADYDKHKLFPASSVGLPLIKVEVIRAGARFTEQEEIVGLCKSIRKLGYHIMVDPTLIVTHPRNGTVVPPNYEA